MGFLITFEGIEGCGKSTQVKLLSEKLKGLGMPCVVTREPGGTPIGLKIREILLNPDYKGMASETELLLYAADRSQHVREIIKPAVDSGKVVVCDRFTDATLAYQGLGRGLNIPLINQLSGIASLGIRPDLTFLLDCPVEIGIKRALERNSRNISANDDRFERESKDFHQKVRDGYLGIASTEPDRVKVIDACHDVDAVQKEIWEIARLKISH